MTDDANLLGDHLRARRELVTPEQAGIPVLGVRRVPGLRREEVAMLAGISADYYLRLEQGRDRNPSVQVLGSIARVLQLDDDTTAYLLGLAADKPRRTRRRPRKEVVPSGIAKLVEALPLPAFVEGRCFDVLAANPLATAISPRLTVGANRLRDGSSTRGSRRSSRTGRRRPRDCWPASGSPSAPTPTMPASSSSSESSRWPARTSAGCGPGTT